MRTLERDLPWAKAGTSFVGWSGGCESQAIPCGRLGNSSQLVRPLERRVPLNPIVQRYQSSLVAALSLVFDRVSHGASQR